MGSGLVRYTNKNFQSHIQNNTDSTNHWAVWEVIRSLLQNIWLEGFVLGTDRCVSGVYNNKIKGLWHWAYILLGTENDMCIIWVTSGYALFLEKMSVTQLNHLESICSCIEMIFLVDLYPRKRNTVISKTTHLG